MKFKIFSQTSDTIHSKQEKLKEEETMRKNKDEYACINKTRNIGRMVVVTVAVLAICIIGVLYAKKLQLDQKYITMNTVEDTTEINI